MGRRYVEEPNCTNTPDWEYGHWVMRPLMFLLCVKPGYGQIQANEPILADYSFADD